MLDPKIVFKGIECPSLRQQLKNLVEDLTQLCPSDSCVSATFQQSTDQFLADIKIASESVYMHARDHADALTDALDHVKSDLMAQIVDWRNHRFLSKAMH